MAAPSSAGFPTLLELQLEMSQRALLDGVRRGAVRVLRGWAILGLATALCNRLDSNEAFAGFVFLAAVLLNCLDSGLVEAALVSLAAVLSLDYYFIEPRLHLSVASPVDVAALVAFATASLVTTQLASRARRASRAAERERRKLERLYDLSQRLLTLNPVAAGSNEAVAAVCAALQLNAVCLFDAGSARSYFAGGSAGGLDDRTRDAYIANRNVDDREAKVSVRCLYAGGRYLGAIGLEGPEDPAEVAGPAAAMVAAMLLRHDATVGAAEAEAAARTETLRAAILDALAHEFKTPLATILTAAGGLRAAATLQPEQEELAELVESETERLSGLSSRLLRLARLDREEVKPCLEPVDIATEVRDAAERQMRYSLERKFEITGDATGEELAADAELLQLALGQLMDNACRYSSPESAVKVRTEVANGFANVTVWNSGQPIEAGDRERIFERFYRGRDGRKASAGTGLGLYVARKIAMAHGGSLELEPARAGENGVAFRLRLPLAKGIREPVESKSQSVDRG